MPNARFLVVSSLFTASAAAHAQEQVRLSADVDASVGYSRNPFSQSGTSGGSAVASLGITPQLQVVQAHSTFTAVASARIDQYLSHYPTTAAYRGTLAYNGRPTERITTFARIDLSSSILGSFGDFPIGIITLPPTGGQAAPDQPPSTGPVIGDGAVPVIPGLGGLGSDIGFFGTRERRRSVYATSGLTAALSARDSVSVSSFVDYARYRRFVASDYDGYGVSLSYSRQLSAYTSLGLRGSSSRYSYRGFSRDTRVQSVEATGSTRLNRFWTVQGAVGVSFVTGGTTGAGNSTSLSGNVEICRQGAQSFFCLSASRAARATGLNGSQYVSTLGTSYQRRITQRARVGFTASFVKEGGNRPLANVPDRYVFVSPSYTHQLTERLDLSASLRYRQLFGGTVSNSRDYGGQLGISYHFGRLR